MSVPTTEQRSASRVRWRRGARLLRDLALTCIGAVLLSQILGAWRAPTLPDQAPSFALLDLDGQTVQLSDYRGRKVILNFWATWCTPCRLEIPSLNRWARSHPDAIILGVAADGTAEELREAIREFGIEYPVLRGTRAVFQRYGVDTYPTTVVVGPKGRVQAAHTGLLLDPQLLWLARDR